jgi:hypothetical protein
VCVTPRLVDIFSRYGRRRHKRVVAGRCGHAWRRTGPIYATGQLRFKAAVRTLPNYGLQGSTHPGRSPAVNSLRTLVSTKHRPYPLQFCLHIPNNLLHSFRKVGWLGYRGRVHKSDNVQVFFDCSWLINLDPISPADSGHRSSIASFRIEIFVTATSGEMVFAGCNRSSNTGFDRTQTRCTANDPLLLT